MALAWRPSRPGELARVEDRVSFLYLEHCVIARDDNALTATDAQGTVHVPSAGLVVLMLGPGTNVTHAAMNVVADGGCAVVWVGEEGVRYYAHGRPIGRSTRLLLRQAALVSNRTHRLGVARAMYQLRFPDEDVGRCTMQQLRGREGARIRALYREWSSATGVRWDRRVYDPDDFAGSDLINQALSAAHACLYGVVHGVVVALGCSPGLGFVHSGHDRSFVYDIADLYKADVTIPLAFEMVRDWPHGDTPMSRGNDFASMVRRAVRDRIRSHRLIPRIVADVFALLDEGLADANSSPFEVLGVSEAGVVLWDEKVGAVKAGVAYGVDDLGLRGDGWSSGSDSLS